LQPLSRPCHGELQYNHGPQPRPYATTATATTTAWPDHHRRCCSGLAESYAAQEERWVRPRGPIGLTLSTISAQLMCSPPRSPQRSPLTASPRDMMMERPQRQRYSTWLQRPHGASAPSVCKQTDHTALSGYTAAGPSPWGCRMPSSIPCPRQGCQQPAAAGSVTAFSAHRRSVPSASARDRLRGTASPPS
jgi:hypothetical protein